MRATFWRTISILVGAASLLLLVSGIGAVASGAIGGAVVCLVLTAGLAALMRRTWKTASTPAARRSSSAKIPTGVPTPAPAPAKSLSEADAPGLTGQAASMPVEKHEPSPSPRIAIQPRTEPSRPRSRRFLTAKKAPNQPVRLFQYGDIGPGIEHTGPYALVDVETTGLSAARGDRVIEIAIVRIDATGRIEDEFCTLVNPEGRDTGAVFIHHITNEAVAQAPRFEEVADDIVMRLAGTVAVAHNAPFDESFISAELARIGRTDITIPALCSLDLSRNVLDAPNYKLGTLARQLNVGLPDAHSALGDVRALAQIFPRLLERHDEGLRFPIAPYSFDLATAHPSEHIVTRASNLRKGDEGWMNNLVNRLPMSGLAASDSVSFAYLDALGTALADGKIIGTEAKALASIAGNGGLGAAQVRALNEEFLESMRRAAFDDSILTNSELKELRGAAAALGVPDYFDDLRADEPLPPAATATFDSATSAGLDASAPRVRRCGHCRQPGHYRNRCPELAGVSG